MVPTRSNEAIQGSVEAESSPQLAEPAGYANTRVACSNRDAARPVNVTLASLAFSHSGASPRRDHTELLSSIDNLFGEQHHTNESATEAPKATRAVVAHKALASGRLSPETALRGVGSRFDGTRSTAEGSSAGTGRQ
ncbi:hypothetical protein F4781DRAFT_102133 [Annulohypoxylon bovei var. microspora]|nr:hypothetical protein F4781DRAFT_102133 [Annulohypoxylon bovei var. microspora]